jgi:hypothetical protein
VSPEVFPVAAQPPGDAVPERTVPVVAAVVGNAAAPDEPLLQPWFVWGSAVGVGMIVGSALRWYGYGGFLTARVRRLFRSLFHRLPTEGNA